MISPDVVRVERILVQRHLDRPARELFEFSGAPTSPPTATVAEVAQHVDLATLVVLEQRLP